MTLTITCPDCGATYVVGRKCRCQAPTPWAIPPPRPSGRRPKGSVKDVVLRAFDKKMTVPEAAKLTGLNPHTIYNAATRLGIRLPRVYR